MLIADLEVDVAMNLRVLTIYDRIESNPFLSARAANHEWLPAALATIGIEAIDHVSRDREPDIVHVHGSHSGTATLRTAYEAGSTTRATVAVAAALLDESDPAAGVVYPVINPDELPIVRDVGDHLAMTFDGRDEHALAASIALATRTERPLVVLLDETALVTNECEAVLASGSETGWLKVRHCGRGEFPHEIASAATYLSFARHAFDMGALTALACGTPVLTVPGSTAGEIIVHGESGFVTSIENAEACLEQASHLSSDRGRVRARLLFHPQVAARAYAELYRQLELGALPRFRHPERPQPGVAISAR